jgi:hypothetical protein
VTIDLTVDGALFAVEEIHFPDDCPTCGAVGHPVDIGREAWRECANAHRWAVEVRSETEEKR